MFKRFQVYRFVLFALFFSGCTGFAPTTREGAPDSRESQTGFESLFGVKQPGSFSGIRYYENVGPMDGVYLVAFNFSRTEDVQAFVERMRLQKPEKKGYYAAVGTFPDWWKREPLDSRLKWIKSGFKGAEGVFVLWMDSETKKVYAQHNRF